ncbi:hypothetical protein [Pseudoalteromonas sp. SG44-17]|nr:hypothetical protein [Pseudoalteromonas sp. SG44-17]MBB1408277.1 hypothetical protein [Pseudoalteromonas sp. SG44-17]
MMQSIDTLLAHEIGHTTVFLSNFANAPSPNENWTVTNGEDIYRSWKKLP